MGWKIKGTNDICVGDIKTIATQTAPTGWLLCDGSAVSRTSYANLFNAIGTNYGNGDGSTTFNVPDFRGKVGTGRDAAQTEFNILGKTGGEKTHTLTTNEMNHSHNLSGRGYSDYSNNNLWGANGVSGITSNSPTAHNNLQPYVIVNYAIKY